MKKSIASFIIVMMLIASSSFAQVSNYSSDKKGELIGFHFNSIDFITPKTWADKNSPRRFAHFADMDYGLSLSYLRGYKPNIDFALKLSGMIHNYAGDRNQGTNKTEFGLEIEPTVNAHALPDNNFFSPFLTAGLGAGLYTGKFGAYVPAGVGDQLNFNSLTYLMLQANYRFSLTQKNLDDHLVYSFGILHNIGTEPKPVVVPPAPPVVLDRDKDGIPDEEDRCPDVAGLASLKGCPDKDADGIADADDKCPDVAGTLKYKGCPIPDTDGDGINDEQDKCVTVKGVARYQGCPIPDTDGDGINDENDKCPDVVGTADNNGCPKLESIKINDGKETYTFSASNVQFITGSATLTVDAKKELDKLTKLMNQLPKIGVNIDGYADNTGGSQVNLSLSQKRSEAVKLYLEKAGIASSRLTATGHGMDKPIADNKTAEGRAKNRRVEFSARQ